MNATPSYYLSISGKEYGPYTVDDLHAAISENTITPDCPVRSGIGGVWTPAIQVIGGSIETPLTGVRRKTLYGGLRGLISLATVVGILILWSLFAYTVYEAVRSGEILHILAAAEYLAWSLAVLVGRGLANVVIDIADGLIMKK